MDSGSLMDMGDLLCAALCIYFKGFLFRPLLILSLFLRIRLPCNHILCNQSAITQGLCLESETQEAILLSQGSPALL